MVKTNKFSRKPKSNNRLLVNTLHSIISSRLQLMYGLGQSYDGKRNLYEDLGYTLNPTFENYYGRYKRQDIASAIINAYPNACWVNPPEISEDEEEETEFETVWKDLVKEKRIFNYLLRADKISGIGNYSILLFGLDDGATFSSPVTKAKELMYLQTYMQNSAEIESYESDEKNIRFGLPKEYNIKLTTADKSGTVNKRVHFSRCLHIAENLLDNDIEGLPRLENILNRLEDLEKIVGGSGEMFWRGAFPGFAFKKQPDAIFDPEQGTAALEDEIDSYIHGLQRYMKLEGIDIESLTPQVVTPTAHVDAILDLIAGTTGIPKRILIGSERGELASSQDETSWNKKIEGRQKNHCEPNILRPFIDRLIEFGVLPEPKQGYTVKWKSLYMLTDAEKATTAATKTSAIVAYANSSAAETVMPLQIFLKKIMELTDEEIENITSQLAGLIKEEEFIQMEE